MGEGYLDFYSSVDANLFISSRANFSISKLDNVLFDSSFIIYENYSLAYLSNIQALNSSKLRL